MTTVTGLTAERMLEIEAASVVDGDIVDGHLILTKHGGDQVDAGLVMGPPGPVGPIGSDLEILVERTILDVGIPNQIRAGREIQVEDFVHLGLDVPASLWHLSNFDDSSGNDQDLIEKGTVSLARGINGLDATAMQFPGSLTEALYILDTGVPEDPFRIRTGSIGAWVRTTKQGVTQTIISKRTGTTQIGYWLRINTTNVASFAISKDGTTAGVVEVTGLSKICDDRWHFLVGAFDGTLLALYVDGILEASKVSSSLIHPSTGPLNLGAYGANAATNGAEPHYGRIDEGFITPETLTQDRVRNLFCARIPHTLGVVPSRVSLSVYPSCKGASLLVSDFPAAYPPIRLYNFSAGSLISEGSDSTALVATPSGALISVAGVDGTKENAYNLTGTSQRLTSADNVGAGLPDGTEDHSYGCWFKTVNGTATMYIMTWGTTNDNNDTRLYIAAGKLWFGSGTSEQDSGIFVSDGDWHFVSVTQGFIDNTDVRRRLYLDGRLIASSTVVGSITLGGPNKFCVGCNLLTAQNFAGQLDTVFVVGVAMNLDEITKLFSKTLHEHMPSPKNPGDHIEVMEDDHLLVAFDTLDISNRVNIKVAA